MLTLFLKISLIIRRRVLSHIDFVVRTVFHYTVLNMSSPSISSSNKTITQQAKELLTPSKEETVLYIILSVALLGVLNYRVFVQLLTGGSDIESIGGGTLIDPSLTYVIYQANYALGTAIVVTFWMIVGSIAYAVVWFFRSLALQAKEDSENLDLTPEQLRDNYKHSLISRYSALLAITVGIIGYALLLFTWVLPVLSKKVVTWATVDTSLSSYLWLLASIAILALGFFMLKILIHIFRYMMGAVSH